MKPIIGSIMLIALSLSVFGQNSNLDKMLNEAQSLIQKRKFKSAANLAVKIQNEARKNEADIDYVKAVEIELKANQWFKYETFEMALNSLQKHIEQSFGRTEILLHVYKIHAIEQYYRQNKYKLQHNIDDGILNKEPMQWAQQDVLMLIDNEVKAIIEVKNEAELSGKEFEKFSPANKIDGIRPSKIVNLALLTAIQSVQGFDGKYIFTNDHFYSPEDQFIKVFSEVEEVHPLAFSAKYFAWLLKNNEKPDNELAIHFNLMRLKHMYENDEQYDKLTGYKNALDPFTKVESPAMALASVRLAELYVGFANRSFHDEQNQSKAVAWQQKALNLCKNAIKKYPKSYGARLCENQIKEIQAPNLNIQMQEYVIPNRPIPVRLEYKNQKWVKISVYQISSEDFMHAQTRRGDLNPEKLTRVWGKKVILPQYDGFFTHSVVAVLPKLEKGFYYVDLETEKPLKTNNRNQNRMVVNSTNLATFSKPEMGKTHFRVTERISGATVSSGKLAIIDRNYDYRSRIQSFTVDHEMTFKNGSAKIETKHNDDFLQIVSRNDTLTQSFGANYLRERNQRKRKRVNIFTDRSIYRPGQVVYFKGILSENQGNEYSPVGDEQVTVSVVNTNHKVIKKLELTTNGFGSFEGKFNIPEQTRPGTMRIRTSMGSYAFQVQYYKRPTFDVTFEPTTQLAKPGNNVKINLNCKSFSGAPIENANVETTVKLRASFFKYWFPNTSEMVVAHLNDSTNAEGKATLSFKSLPDQQAQTYIVESTVTLPDGASREFNYQYTVSPKPIQVSLGIEGNVMNAADKPEISIKGINGETVKGEVEMRVNLLKSSDDYFYEMPFSYADSVLENEEEWKENFPGMAWNKSLMADKQKVEDNVLSITTAGEKMHFPNDKKLKEGWYQFQFLIADTVYNSQYIKVVDNENKRCNLNTPLIMMPDRTETKPGETLSLYFMSRFDKARVMVLVSDKDGILIEEELELKSRKEIISVPVQKRSEGAIRISAILLREGRQFTINKTIPVEPVSRKIEVEIESLREKLQPGEKEKWTVSLTKNSQPAENTEVLAAMYDMSLDEFKKHSWSAPFQIAHFYRLHYRSQSFSNAYFRYYLPLERFEHKEFNWYMSNPFGYSYGRHHSRPMLREGMRKTTASPGDKGVRTQGAIQPEEEEAEQDDVDMDAEFAEQEQESEQQEPATPSVRTNFNETAFFYPLLQSDKQGKTQIEFTVPESMSRWKIQLLAHDKQMAAGYAKYEVVTQKPLMVIPNKLRFVHQGDNVTVQAMAYNLTDSAIVVQPSALITNAVSGDDIPGAVSPKEIEIQPNGSESFTVSFTVPQRLNALTYQITGKSGSFSDGELHTIPVHPSRQQIINTMALWNKPGEKKTYKFASLNKLESETAENHSLTFEITTNPVWFAIKAMPAVYRSQSKSAIQLARNFRVTATGNEIIQGNPEIERVFKVWQQAQPEALESPLRKNETLRNLLLSETPWDQMADNEELQRGVLMEMLNPNFVDQNLESALNQLETMQMNNGAFSWRPGMRASFYFTLQTAYNLAQTLHLDKVKSTDAQKIVRKSVDYLQSQMEKRYRNLLHYGADTANYETSTDAMMYLLIRKKLDGNYEPVSVYDKFFYKHARKYEKMNLYQLTLSGVLAFEFKNNTYASLVVDRLHERAVVDSETGIYWKNNSSGWNWDEAPIQTHAAIIEFFSQMKQPTEEIEAMKMWLIRQKQGQDWKNADASLAAVHALVNTGRDWTKKQEPVKITIGNLTISSDEQPQEAGTGYFQKSIDEPNEQMEQIIVDNPGTVPVWGAVYHIFTEEFQNMAAWEDQMSIERKLFRIKSTEKGEKMEQIDPEKTSLKVGDRVRVQLTVKSKRELDYVWIKSPHAACFEPVKQLSGYQWKGGLYYYAESHDAEKRFFMNRLKNGTFVMHYDLFVERNGTYKSGPVEIQSAYAPEFGAHTGGYNVQVE